MNSIGTLMVRILQCELHIVLLCVGFAAASNPCPAGQYLDRSKCVDCRHCPVGNYLRQCDGYQDALCRLTTTQKSVPKKTQTLPKKKHGKKRAVPENDGALFETDSSYNIMLAGPKNRPKNTFATMIQKSDEGKRNFSKSSPSKSFDKNGKHIKKDLSSADETRPSKLNNVRINSLYEKDSLKPKEMKGVLLDDDKWEPIIRADPVNHQITVEVDPMPMRRIDEKPVEMTKIDSGKMKNKKMPIESNQDDDYDDSRQTDDLDYVEEENDEYVDSEEDDESSAPISMVEIKMSEKPFDVEEILLKSVNDVVGDDSEEVVTEPYIDTSNWQLLVLVSAASACFLFFIVVNVYFCIYIKRWRRHMKQGFEAAGVEELAVRINLMQHAGLDPDESNNVRNYISQRTGRKSSVGKKPMSTV